MFKLVLTTATAVTLAGASFAQSAGGDEMRDLTSSVLAGITGKAPEKAGPAAVETGALKQLVEQAVSEGQSDAYLDALINEAAEKGQIEVPDAMRTTDGDVDTKTLLASLVEKSLDEQSPASASVAAEVEPQEDRYYVVKAGDSLAAIALIYYDSAPAYERIFNANRDQIRSPDRIGVGQRLLIPR